MLVQKRSIGSPINFTRPKLNLLMRAALTKRCAGEGELIFGLTRRGWMLAVRRLVRQWLRFGLAH
jgi:hypothetical protein